MNERPKVLFKSSIENFGLVVDFRMVQGTHLQLSTT